NIFCEIEGEAPMYADVGADRAKPLAAFRSDQFFGRPMATAAREILEQRGVRNFGAISLDELYDTMKAGGFDFENKNDQIAKRNLAITLAKNPAFTRVPANGFIGLTQWYPNVKKKKDAKNQENGAEGDQPDESLSAKATRKEDV